MTEMMTAGAWARHVTQNGRDSNGRCTKLVPTENLGREHARRRVPSGGSWFES